MIVVYGSWSSGSSTIAGILHHLGVNMGAPFIQTRDPRTPNSYESRSLCRFLCQNLDQATLERSPDADSNSIIAGLRAWSSGKGEPFGAKHPLLSMIMEECDQAWGEHKRIIIWRPETEILASFKRRNWSFFRDDTPRRIYAEIVKKCLDRSYLMLHYSNVIADSRSAVDQIISYCELQPTNQQISTAVDFVRVNDGIQN